MGSFVPPAGDPVHLCESVIVGRRPYLCPHIDAVDTNLKALLVEIANATANQTMVPAYRDKRVGWLGEDLNRLLEHRFYLMTVCA